MYHFHQLNLTRNQANSLLQGGLIHINNDCLKDGNIGIYLTANQLNKLNKIKSNTRGTSLRLSTSQIQYNFKNGQGPWRNLMSKLLINQLKESPKPLIRKIKNKEEKNNSELSDTDQSNSNSECDSESHSISKNFKLPLIPSNNQ